jgi:NAD(P) transhydrogenase alpha subunit
MGKIAGHRAVVEALHVYQGFFTGEITAAGKFAPAKVLVLGVGVAGLAAIGTAVSLGAEVYAWDVRPIQDQVASLGANWIEVDFKEDGQGAGGYAKESSEAFQQVQWRKFHDYLRVCNICITTAAIPGRQSPLLVKEYMLDDMQPGSVLVDLGALGGGNCEATQANKSIVYKDRVTIIGYTDMQSRMARQASAMYSNNVVHLMDELGRGEKFMERMGMSIESMDDIQRGITVVHSGQVTHPPPKLAEPSKAPSPSKAPASSASKREQSEPSWMDNTIDIAGQRILTVREGLTILGAGAITAFVALLAPESLVSLLFVLMLACAVGLLLVGGVQPALHTPLMSVSNAISGQVILGGMFQVSAPAGGLTMLLGALAVFVAAVNIAGGFLVTQRMLGMFKAGNSGGASAGSSSASTTYGKLANQV